MTARYPAALVVWAALAAPAAGQLAIGNAAIEETEGGVALPASFQHIPGQILFFAFQVQGYRASADQKIRLAYTIDALDPKGIPIVEPIRQTIEAELAPQDKEWKPKARHEIPLPALAPSGTYKLVVTVSDEFAKTTAKKEVPFEVRGRNVPPSDSLVVRNFGFYRSEEDRQPLAKPAYRPGDSVWARFDITGFRYGPGNRIDVSYGIAVLDASGKQLWAQPEAAAERSESFYPKPYVPGSMSLNLQPNIRPGTYAIAVTVRDGVGNQNYETTQTFTVE